MACTMEPTKKFKTELRFLARDVGYVGLLLQKEVQKCMAKFDSTGDTGLLCRKLAKLFNTYSNHMNQYAKDLTERINKAGKEVEHREALECLQHLICKKSELNCINCGQNGTSSGPLIENPAIEPTNNHVSTEQEVDYALSQGSSVHLGNEVKDEQAASQEETQTDNGAFIDLSVIDSTSSERSTNESSSTIVYNSSEKHSQQLEEDQNLDNDPNTEETIGSSLGDIFEEESAPSNLPDIDPEQSRPTNDLDKTANTSSDIRSAEVDDVHAANNEHLPHGSEDVVSSSERTKQKHSSIDESDDDDIEIVTSTSATVPNTVATAVSSPASSEETVANSPAEVAKSHDSDATVASLSPPQESRREWNVTASNDLLDQSGGTSTDFSQVFELSKDKSAKESVGNHEDDADFDVLTQVASKTKEIDDANAKSADSDVDFDLDTQPAVTDACDNIVDADSDVDFDAPTQVSLEKAIDRQEELSDKTDSLLSEGQDESGTKPSEVKKDAVTLDKPTTDGDVNADLVGCDSAEKLEFLKSLAVIPRDSPENNGQHDKSAPEHANANKESSRVPLEDLDKSKKPSSEADRSSAPEGTSHSDSDILGDISGSDTSGEETKSKPKKKLTPKDKESVMKLISEFYSKRKLERMGLLEEHPEKTAKKPQRRRRKPRKLSTSPNKSENTSKSSKKLLEESDDEVKTATSKSRSESVQDDMEIHEVISSDNQATTQITTVVQPTTESASDKIIDDHSDNSGDSAQKSKVIASAVNGTTDVDKIDDIEDLEATQRVDIRTLKWLSEGSSNMPIWDERAPERANSDGTNQLMNPSKPTTTPSDVIALSSTESDSSPVVEPFKRKAVLPLPNTQSDADSISTDVEDSSQVVKPFRKKPVQPLPATQSDAADTDDVEASSQVVKPVRNKPVCTQTDDESPQLSFKRKAVLPLTSSHSDSEGSSGGTNVQRKSFKRTRHSSEPSKTSDEVDFEAETQAGSTPADTDDCSEGSTQEQPPPAKRARTCSKDSEIIIEKPSSSGSSSSEGDDLPQEGPNTAKVDQEMAKALVNNEGDLKQATEDFKLTDQDKDELLAFLIERMNEEAVSSGEDDCDDVKTQLDDKDAVPGEKRKATEENTEPAKRRRAIEGLLNKDTLLELLEEFEEAQRKQGGVTPIDQVSITVATKSPANALTTDMGLDLLLENLYWDSEKDSEEASVLLDFVREEAVDASETDCSKRGPGRPKDNSKEAWQAYQSLLKEDDRMSDTSSDSSDGDLDLNDLGMNPDFSDKVSRQAQGARNVELLRTFGIHKELIIDLEELDVSGYDDLRSSRLQRGDSVDRLCDLSNMLQKRIKGGASHRRPKLKRLQSQSSNSSSGESAESDDEESESSEDDDSDSSIQAQRESTPHIISDDDDFERLANALWDDIKNSSDDQSDGSGSPEEGVSSGSESEKKGKRSSPKGGGSKTKASKALKSDGSGGSTTSSSSSSNSSSSSSSSESDDDKDNKKETTDSIIQKADLDSSDEEDFVGVRKGRGAWRHDPLLKGCITTTSDDSDSEQLGAPANKRLHKRRQKRLKSESQDGSDSDVTVVEEDSKTPVKKPFQFISSDDSDFEIIETQKTPLKTIVITDEEDTPGKKGKGRRNIRALVEEDDLAEATQRANNEERERIRRLQERDKAKKSFTQSQSFSSQLTEDDPDPMVLDVYDDVQIKVHPKIVQKLKPHQRRGIEFMWDSCYLSLKDLKEEGYRGSGCILAHCMGLGKTLQALALIQALFSCPLTKTKHVLVVCPLSTVLNWRNEYNLAYKDIKHSRVKLYTIENTKVASRRLNIVTKWWRTGGVLVLGYECFGLLSNESKLKKWENQTAFNKEDILKALVDPGPDLVICDEGHLLRNKQSQRTLALNQVKTKRRIVLTGTPLQNNLLEYYNMVQFVKEDILGNEKEFKTNFVNPITNGQFEDSTAEDIMFMKKRTHCLHKILANTVQRVEDTELKQYLPKLVDQAVFVKLSDLQVKLYNTYLDAVNSRPVVYTKSGQVSHKNFLADVQILRYICLHPNVVTIAEKNSKSKIKEQDVIEDNLEDDVEEKVVISKGDWYKDVLEPDETKKLESGSKLMVAISIMREAAANGDKVLIFSQSYAEMDSLEAFMSQQLDYKKGRDYYRMDGTISPEVRTHMCDKFNAKDIKVFIMSTKVGGLGLNLTAANRILIMNVNWNPSWDTQSVFRSFRFGQTKAVYVYRLVALDTMEEKMYQRVVTKLAVAHRVVDKHQITRHYSAADIQEFYSARPVIEKNRPVPNVPEDRVLASLIQRHQFVFRWHEHQALLANRPEEDLDEQQKNAAWDEYNKKSIEPTLPQVSLGATAPMLPTNAPASSSAQPGPSGLHNQVNAGRPNPSASLHPDHNYSLPKNTAVMHPRTIPPDEILRAIQLRYTPRQPFGPSPTGVGGTNAVRQLVPTPKPKQVDGGGGIFAPPGVGGANAARHTVATPKPKQVDVGGGIFAPPGVGGANAVRHPVPVATPKSKQVDVGGCGTFAPPGVGGANAARHPVATPKPKQVDIGGGISISREEPNSATAPPPPPAHVQKPSVSIHSSTAPIPINLSKKTHNGAIQRINGSNAHDIVQNPANAHVMLSRKIEAMKGLINNNNATPSKRNGAIQQNQFNGKVSDTQNYIGLKEAPRPDVTHIKIQSLKAKTLAKMKSHALKMKGRPPKHIMTPRLTKPTQAPPPLVVTNSPVSASSSPNNNPSPANHQSPLQKQMRTFMDHLHRLQKQMEAGTPPAAKTTTELEPSILNKHKLPSSMSIVRVSPKAASNGNRTSASHAPSSLGAARNLSSFAHAQKQSLERIKGCGSAPKKVAANHKPVVRVIGPMPNQGGGATRKMRINGIPVTKVVQPISPNIVKRLVNKQLVPPLSPGAKKVIISQKLGSSPGHQRVVSAQPTIGGSPLQKRMVANFNKLTKAAITPPASPPSRFKNSANLKTYQHKKNGHHQSFRTSPFWCASGAPAAPVTSAASISNKENIKKKRVPMRSVNGATVAASIDLSKEKGSGSDSPLSQEVVNTLKRKGVSINYVGKEAVNSEGVIQLD